MLNTCQTGKFQQCNVFLNVSSNLTDLEMYFTQTWEELKDKGGEKQTNIHSIIGLQFKMTINFFKILFQKSQNVITKETGGFAR